MKTLDQIKGQIADTESKIQTLVQNHEKMVNQFNQAVVQNQAEFNRLNGQLEAYKSMLEQPELEVVKPEEPPAT